MAQARRIIGREQSVPGVPRYRALRFAFSVVAGVFLALANPAPGQEAAAPPIVAPDRPDLSNGIQIVPVGYVQVEGGLTAARLGGTTNLTVGELMVRIPFSSRVEVGVQLFDWGASWGSGTSHGATDPVVDVKWKIFDSESTDFGVILGTSLPLGARSFGEPHLQPYAVLSVDQVISEKVSVTVNAGVVRGSAGGETFDGQFGGASTSFQVSPKVSLFLELFGWSRTEPGGPGQQVVDGGLEYLVTNRLMLDARIGAGFGRTASDGFLGIGASFLF